MDFEYWTWWCRPEIPALGRLRQQDLEFKTSPGYTVRLCLKKKKPCYTVGLVRRGRSQRVPSSLKSLYLQMTLITHAG
jgi:hypothetical protein